MAHVPEKLDAYPETILAFAGPPAFRVDLRRPLTDDDRARIAALGLGDRLAVLTAENPEGEHPDDAEAPVEEAQSRRENAARTRTLMQALEELALPFVRVDGTAPTGDYCERCVAVPLPPDRALALAAEARQLALFWYDGRAFWLVPAEADGAPRRLPLDAPRPSGGPPPGV